MSMSPYTLDGASRYVSAIQALHYLGYPPREMAYGS